MSIRPRLKNSFSVLCVTISLSAFTAWAEPSNQAKLIRLPKAAKTSTLRIKQHEVETRPAFSDSGEPSGTAQVEGTFPDPNSSLLISDQDEARIPLEKSEKFSLSIPIIGPTTFFTLTKIGPRGDIHTEKLQIEFQQWPAWIAQTTKSNLNAIANTPRLVLTPGFGITQQHSKKDAEKMRRPSVRCDLTNLHPIKNPRSSPYVLY